MQNKKKIGLVFCLVALLVVGTLCLAACTQKDTGGAITFEGVEEIHAPVGTVTEESLLAGVTAVDANGKNKTVSIDLEGADLSKPGCYFVKYTAGNSTKREAVYLYGDISFLVNGQSLEGDKIEIDFATAIYSLDFSKIASATDSFGNEITVAIVEGDKFDDAVGEYTVKYRATDKAGQTVEKTVTYVVTSDIEMTVQSGVSVKYEQESVTFKVDLDGESDVWLMANGGLVSVRDYSITKNSLELKASYFRTLAPGENTLKICSVNGSTEFTFTVVDTGKPLFTFDSIYKTNIIAGNAVVYEMPQSQIAGHEYSYSFKVTKNGVSYKAEQRGNNLVITTSSGKSLGAGIYDITVTATNMADTSKKTTIKRDFRIYTNQKEIDGWQFVNFGGSTLVNVDLSDKGYYRTSYQYDGKTPNSWDGRLQWNGATKKTFQSITFDIYFYSLGVAEKENSPVKFVSKNDANANVPFYVAAMNDEGIAKVFYDQDGKIVDENELKLGTWYSVKLDVSELLAEKTDLYWVFGVSNKWQVGAYITEMHFWAYEGSGAQNVYRDDDKTVSLQRNGGKSTFASGTVEGENIWLYTVTEKHVPSTAITRSLKATTSKSKEVISVDFKFLEDPKDADGNVLKPTMYVHDVDYRSDGVFGASYAVVDAETGETAGELEVGKWYTLWITTQGRANYLIYPMGNVATQLTCKVAFKDLQSHDVELGGAQMIAASGNNARTSLYKTTEGAWQYSYASYTDLDGRNTAWDRRPQIKTSGDVSEVRFQFKFDVADSYRPGDPEKNEPETVYSQIVNLFAWTESSDHPALVTAIYDENYKAVPAADMEIGKWYYCMISRADGKPFEHTFSMLPGGYADGGVNDAIVNIEMTVRDLVAVAPGAVQIFEVADGAVTIQPAGSVSTLTKEEDSETIRYQLSADRGSYTPAEKGIKVTLNDTAKQVISMQFTVNSCKTSDGTDTAAWVRVDTISGYDGNYVVIDENGDAVKNVEAGKTYVLFITIPENSPNLYGQTKTPTEFVAYLTGKEGQQFADMTIGEIKVYEVSSIATENMDITYKTHLIHNNVSYYLYNEKWNLARADYTALYSTSPTVTTHSAENRGLYLTLGREDIAQLNMRVRFDESNSNGSDLITFVVSHYVADGFKNHNVLFFKDGVVVAEADRQVGQWYDVVITPNGSACFPAELSLYMFGYGTANAEAPMNSLVQITDIQGRVADGFTVVTPDLYADPLLVYNEADGWHYTIADDGKTYSAWQRRVDFGGSAVSGAEKVTFEVRINSISGDATARLGTMETLREFYELDGTYLGSNNDVELEIGKWYKVVATNGDQGALMGESFQCYPGDATHNAGNISISFRNFEATYQSLAVDFNLNYEGATGTPDAIEVIGGKAYGELPTAEREGYIFGGWYTDAACSGDAVNAETIVTASHTLYAKWFSVTEPVGPAVVAGTPANLTEADENQKTAAGVDPAQKMYVYTKTAGESADLDNAASMYFSNENGYDYISFDVYFASMPSGQQDSKPYLAMKAYNNLVAADATETTQTADGLGLTIVNKATGELNTEYVGEATWGKVEMNTWYTVTCKVTDWARVGVVLWSSASAEVYFTNVKGYEGDLPVTPEPAPSVPEDSNPVVVGSAVNGTVAHDFVSDKHIYTYTTRGTAGTAGQWARRVNISFPEGQTFVAVEFRFTEAMTANGTPFAPSLGVLYDSQGNGGDYINSLAIYDANGNQIANSNAATGLTVGEWYILVAGLKSTTKLELYPAHNHTADVPTVTMQIRERICTTITEADIGNGVLVTTPETDYYADPWVAYTAADGWHYCIPNNGSTYSAWQRRVEFGGAVAGAKQVEFEVRINSISGGCTAQFGTITVNPTKDFYDLETGDYLGSNNEVTLEIGKWYKVIVRGENGALLNNTFQCYPGNAGADGNASVSFRNLNVVMPADVEVTLNLNYETTEADSTTISRTEGTAYGTLPTLLAGIRMKLVPVRL